MTKGRDLILVCGDMLFDRLPDLPSDLPVLMVEDRELCERSNAHKIRIVLFLSAMRHFRDRLRGAGREVVYFELTEERRFFTQLEASLKEFGSERLLTYEVNNDFFRDALLRTCDGMEVELVEIANPMFLTSADHWEHYRSRSERLLMADFYQWQRKRLNILVDSRQRPEGGKWSFDDENRKALPHRYPVPSVWREAPNRITSEVIHSVESEFGRHPGIATNFNFPTDHGSAAYWLDEFLETRLDQFGDFEDAISEEHRVLFHSQLSPLLNCGLLTPSQVIAETLSRHRAKPVPLNSLEGFVRQIIGWREFIRGVYREYRTKKIDYDVPSPFGHTRRLRECWWKGDTGLPPLDLVIHRAIDHGYAHHIERLMVVGSSMLMSEVKPSEAYKWFMELFVDAADWVMAPNVLGMSQFADGGLFATKPYISGSAYLLRMGKFPKGSWCETWDGLFWRFIQKNRTRLEQNARAGLMVRNLDRMEPKKLRTLTAAAEKWIDSVTLA